MDYIIKICHNQYMYEHLVKFTLKKAWFYTICSKIRVYVKIRNPSFYYDFIPKTYVYYIVKLYKTLLKCTLLI